MDKEVVRDDAQTDAVLEKIRRFDGILKEYFVQ